MDRVPLPRSTSGEDWLYAFAASPIQVVRRIVSVPNPGRDSHDALVGVVRERDEELNIRQLTGAHDRDHAETGHWEEYFHDSKPGYSRCSAKRKMSGKIRP